MPDSFKKSKIVVTDTSCFIILQKINALHILNDLFAVVLTTPEIAKEYGLVLPDWIVIQTVINTTLKENFKQHVDPGEASAIALAAETQSDYVLLDDAGAREFAEKLGLPVKGTVGILLIARQQGIIPLIRPYLDLIQQTNFRISQSLINKIILDAGENS